MNKKLPVQEPLITSYGFYANKLSVLASFPETWPWFFSNFIQILCHTDYRVVFYDNMMRNSPWFSSYAVPTDLVKQWSSPVSNFLIDCINRDRYIFLEVDKFYISASDVYHKDHFTHDLFVYGYDLEQSIFYISGSLQDGKYMAGTCSFDEMNVAFEHATITPHSDWFGGVLLYKFKHEKQSRLDLDRIHFLIRHYLKSTNFIPYSNPTVNIEQDQGFTFGLDIYDQLVKGLVILSTGDEALNHSLDIRTYDVLHNHKQTMKARIEYLADRGLVKNDTRHINNYEELNQMSQIMRNLSLKFNLSNNLNIAQNIMDILKEMKEKEKLFLQLLDNDIEHS